jgi:hypothetical protein
MLKIDSYRSLFYFNLFLDTLLFLCKVGNCSSSHMPINYPAAIVFIKGLDDQDVRARANLLV